MVAKVCKKKNKHWEYLLTVAQSDQGRVQTFVHCEAFYVLSGLQAPCN